MDGALRIASDGMSALLTVPPRQRLALEDLRALLLREHVTQGLEPGALLAATQQSESERTLVVARGCAPQHGVDGRVDLLISEPTSVYGEGTIDLHELHHFREVVSGTPLARILPPGTGVPGYDVHGKVLSAKPGRVADFGSMLGPGCAVDEHDALLARAANGGIYQRFTRGGRTYLQVTAEVTVPGDVDMTIGNISSQYPVVVQGDVHATFALKSQQSITVRGSIEDARVSSRGDLVVQGGILQGASRVKAHGDVHARHIASREVKARNVHADFAIHFARILATGRVSAKEIIGGEVLAAGGVTCDTLGDPDGRPTLVQVGVDPFEESLVTWAQSRGGHLEAEIIACRSRCQLLAHRVQTQLSAGDDHTSEDGALRQALSELEDLRRTDARCRAILARHPEHLERAQALLAQAYVEVRRLVNPGTIIRIGESAELVIRVARPACTFRRVGDRIWVG
jgi:hypothetical protein